MSTTIVLPRYECAVCAARLARKQEVTHHLLVHADLNKKYECDLCHRSYSSKKVAAIHRRIHDQIRSKFGCDSCDKCYRRKEDLVRHRREKHPVSGGAFACAKCTSRHPDIPSLLVHLKRCSPVIKCPVCQKAFLRQSVLKQHVHLHSVQKPFTCDICPYATGWRSRLTKHRRNHLVKRAYACDECAASFASDKRLVTHRRVHAVKCELCPPQFTLLGEISCPHVTVKACKCEQCGAAFVTASALCSHRKSHKPLQRSNKRVSCPPCPAKCASKWALDSHVLIFHATSPQATKEHVCELCLITCKNALYLKNHRRRHFRKCFCAQCGQRCSSNGNLRMHISAVHSTERPFKCAVCLRGYHSAYDLRGHMAVHTWSLKRHQCDLCRARFTSLWQLRSHRRHHGGVGDYQCVHCAVQFSLKSALTEHIVAQHFCSTVPDFPWLYCRECRRRFATTEKLRAHEKQHECAQRGLLCDACGRVFKSAEGQRSHYMRRHGCFAYGCAKCLRRYLSRSALMEHLARNCRPYPAFRKRKVANTRHGARKSNDIFSTAAKASTFKMHQQALRTQVKTEPVCSGSSMAEQQKPTAATRLIRTRSQTKAAAAAAPPKPFVVIGPIGPKY